MDKLIILIPAYNELKNLNKIIKPNFNFLVIDDCSIDGTEKFLKEKKIDYLRNKKNIGYEATILKGIKLIIKEFKNYEIICTIDGDNEHPKEKIRRVYEYFLKNDLDLLICNRAKQNRFLEKIYSFLFFKRYKIKDPLSGMKFYKINSQKLILNKVKNNHFLIDLVYYAIKKKFKIKNYKISTKENIKNSKIGYGINVNLKITKLIKYLI